MVSKGGEMTQWKLVPVEPTDEMFFSGCEVQGSEYINVNKLWAAMLNAAPQTDAKPVGKFAKFTDGVWREVTKGSPGVLLYTHPPAADVAELVAHEREACAKVVESYTGAWSDEGYALVQAIRNRDER